MAMPFICRAQEQYKSVETSDLLKTPQKYWARQIVFKDTLTEPPENASVDIEGKRYKAFSTREVGVCYVSAHLLPAMSDLEVKREYLFSGTVFKYRGQYVPIVEFYTSVTDTQELSKDMKTVAEEMPYNFTNQAMRPMIDLLAAVQSAQLAYAKEKNILLHQLYDPTSEHFVKAMDIARTVIYSFEQKNNTTSVEILAQYLSIVLAKQYVPGAASQTVAVTESASPPETQKPSEEVEKTPALLTTNVAPKKLSWSERRIKARAIKGAEPKEKKEQDAAQAAEEAAAEYQTQQNEEDQVLEISTETTKPAEIEIHGAPKEAAPATNRALSSESSARKSSGFSWFHNWRMERQKRMVIDAELHRIKQEKEDAAQRLAAEKKAGRPK